jgi:hypothetical protein
LCYGTTAYLALLHVAEGELLQPQLLDIFFLHGYTAVFWGKAAKTFV